MKKIISLLLVVALLLSMGAVSVSASGYSGTCGENLTWSFDGDTGVLTISGAGEMAFTGDSPWYPFRNVVSSVEFDGAITSIGDVAFKDCENLTSIVIPNSITKIGEWAFWNCPGLTSLEIPSSVTSIGPSAFYRCTGLTSMVIPSSVTSIDAGVFSNCSGLTSIEIPNSVTSIDAGAFSYCTGLTSIEIPNNVTSIGGATFTHCISLTSIVIPSSVTYIENNAFSYCEGLTSLEVEKGNTVYHSSGNCIINTAEKTLLSGCKTSVIPDDGSVTSIGYWAFAGRSGLTSIEIPNRITSIGCWAFLCCDDLINIEIPNGVTTICQEAFMECTSLTDIEIPNSVTSIEFGAFWGCMDLTILCAKESYADSYALSNNINVEYYTPVIIIEKIDALGEITSLSQRTAVVSARAAYEALSAEQKELVTNLSVLTAAEEKIALLIKAEPGDVDGDGNITVSDVVALRKAIMSGVTSVDLLPSGDVDKDGALSVADVVALRKKIMLG